MTEMPEEIFIGRQQGEWPLAVFENESHAVSWLGDSDPQSGRQRRLWKATVSYGAELELVMPVPARLVVKRAQP